MAGMRGHFTIDTGVPFLATLAAAILAGEVIPDLSRASGPLALAATTIYVPTQRAARALQEIFAQEMGGALLLPRIIPLGAVGESETRLLFGVPEPEEGFAGNILPAISPLARRMELMQLVLGWAKAVALAIVSVAEDGSFNLDPAESLLVATRPADAWNLAGALADLIDEMIVEDKDWDKLRPLAGDQFDQYWRITLDFLAIAAQSWPRHLAELGMIDPARRQAALIGEDIARLHKAGVSGLGAPVIVAGSTGAHKATARLIAAVANLPRGAIVLPGLDLRLEDSAFAMIGDGEASSDNGGHPQAGLQRLLVFMQRTRSDFHTLGQAAPAAVQRRIFLSEAMRPADSTDAWSHRHSFVSAPNAALALAGVSVIEAEHEGDEALAIAVVLRQVLEQPGQTAALITPDRTLALRVQAELLRWNIHIADSGGTSLAMTLAGSLALLALECASPLLEAGPLLALLAHPLTRLGGARGTVAALLAPLETGVLRGTLVPGALADPAQLVAQAKAAAKDRHAHPSRARIDAQQWEGIEALLERTLAALAPLLALPGDAPLGDWLAAHGAVVQALMAGATDIAAPGGPDIAELDRLFTDAGKAATPRISLSLFDYLPFFRRLASESVVAPAAPSHPRIAIYGLLEARLLPADLVILGGLDETVWPPQADSGPFLNRPMRAALGLTPPERRIGQTAHDFLSAMGAPAVILSRARKRGGSPTVASRFLQRMAALAGQDLWSACVQRGDAWLALARSLDHGPPVKGRSRPPAPLPPVEVRPTRLSVTQIETLRRDPYAIYAELILKLVALDNLGLDYSARDFGSWLHDALRQFGERFPTGPLPATAGAELEAMARAAFGAMADRPEFQTFHWPRFSRALAKFIVWETARRDTLDLLHVEIKGGLDIDLPDGSTFHLSAQADRLERRKDGTVGIVDYKTGTVPGVKDVADGFAPQMPLEAAIALQGGFAVVAKGTQVSQLLYYKVSDAAKTLERRALGKDGNIAASAPAQFEELVKLLDDFRSPLRSYPSRPFADHPPRFSNYEHLARLKEWGTAGEAEGGEDGEEGEGT